MDSSHFVFCQILQFDLLILQHMAHFSHVDMSLFSLITVPVQLFNVWKRLTVMLWVLILVYFSVVTQKKGLPLFLFLCIMNIYTHCEKGDTKIYT